MKKIIEIKQDNSNIRVDRWIKKNIFLVPQSLIEKSLRHGLIKVNKKRVKSSYKLKINDTVYLYNFNPDVEKKNKKKYIATSKEISSSEKFIIENNQNFVVLNKPSGIPVQGGTKSHKNLVDILSNSKIFNEIKPYIVHRIDKETSGVLLIAKNREYAQLLTSLFRIRKIHKTYLAICEGEFQNNSGELKHTLSRYEKNKRKDEVAKTYFKVLDKNSNTTFLSLNPVTGRKHQIRKQLLLCNHPILGDKKYNFNTKSNKLLLHAYSIKFMINKVKYEFKVKYPDYFEKVLKIKRLKFI